MSGREKVMQLKRIAVFLIVAVMVLNVPMIGGNAQSTNVPPTADAGADQMGPAGAVFSFSGSNSTDQNNDILTFSWDFDSSNGIQEDAFGEDVEHTFYNIGTFTVTLTVSDGSAEDADTLIVTVLDNTTNHRPVAVIDEPGDNSFHNETELIVFDGRGSYDPDREDITWMWDMGDNNHTFYESHFIFKMPHAGVFTVTLTVSDGELSDRSSITLFVYPHAPGIPIPNPDQFTQDRPTIEHDGPWNHYEKAGTWMQARSKDADGESVNICWDMDMSDGIDIVNCDAVNASVIWPFMDPGVYTITIIVSNGPAVGINPNLGKFYNFTQTTANITEHCKPMIKAVDLIKMPRGKDVDKVQVNLNAVASVCSPSNNGAITKYEWDFESDGEFDWTSPNSGSVSHYYEVNISNRGETHFQATVQVTQKNMGILRDNKGGGGDVGFETFFYNITNTHIVNITIEAPPNEMPECSIIDPQRLQNPGGFVGEPLTFRASAFDPDGYIDRYIWDFGDGTEAIGKDVTHSYDSAYPGGILVELTCYDDRNGTATDDAQVIVKKNGIPVAMISGAGSANVGELASFDGSESFDPDGDVLDYMWDFDDSDGVGIDSSDMNPSWTYKAGGVYTVTLKVRDTHNAESEPFEYTIEAVQLYDLDVEASPAKGKGEPGATVPFHIVIKNMGNGDDTFTISPNSGKTAWAVLSVSQVDLSADKSADIQVSVRIPNGEAASTQRIDFDVVSKGDNTVKKEVTLEVQVLEEYDFTMVASKSNLEIKAGEASTVALTITNLGNAEDTIALDASGDGSEWLRFNPTKPSVSKGGKSDVKVSITVPKAADGGDYSITVTAKSERGDATETIVILVSVIPKEGDTGTPGFEGAVMFVALAMVTVALALRRKR